MNVRAPSKATHSAAWVTWHDDEHPWFFVQLGFGIVRYWIHQREICKVQFTIHPGSACTICTMDTETQQRLARNVREARERAGLSKSRFCLMIGLSRPVLDAVEQGSQNVKLETLQKIAEGLDVEPWKLLK